MEAVGRCIVDVVEAVDAAGGETIGEEHENGRPEIDRLEEVTAKKQGQDHKEVLHPLVGPEKEDCVFHFS
jgi:hypothetical protein